MLQNMGMVSITTCRMVEFMNEFGFWPITPGFFQNLGVISKSNAYPLKSVCCLNAEKIRFAVASRTDFGSLKMPAMK